MWKGCFATFTVETEDGDTIDLRCSLQEHEDSAHRAIIWWEDDE